MKNRKVGKSGSKWVSPKEVARFWLEFFIDLNIEISKKEQAKHSREQALKNRFKKP